MSNDKKLKIKSRFYALDGIRGIAAIAVMIYQYTQHTGLNWLKGADAKYWPVILLK